MKKCYSLAAIFVALVISCNSPANKSSIEEPINTKNKLETAVPSGKWIVESEVKYLEKNNKVIEEGELVRIPKNEAFIYDFKSNGLVTVTNLKKDFAWDFKISHTNSILTLNNINGDAEDDEFVYFPVDENKIILHRKMNDADPDDDKGFIVVNYMLTLARVL